MANISVQFAPSGLVTAVSLTRSRSPRIPRMSAITTLQTRSDSALPLCGRYKNGLSLLGEIYETEDTKPRLLIKIIHFGQSGARGGEKCAAAAVPAGNGQASSFLPPLHSFYFINPTSPLPFHTSDGTSPRLSLTSPKSHCV